MPYFPPIQQDQYPATDETQCLEIIIPAGDEFKALLAGLMVAAADVNSYADPASAAAEGQAAIWDEAYSQIDWNGCMPQLTSNQSRFTLWHRWAQIAVGNALQVNVGDTTLITNHYCRQSTAAAGDETYQDLWLAAGDYAMRVLYYRLTTNGKCSFIFQNQNTLEQITPLSAQDLSGSTLANQVLSATFTITDPGHWRMYTHVTAGGASSGGFFVPLIFTEVWKTAD